MLTYEIIERIEALVSKFLNRETYSHSLSNSSKRRELETFYENSTNGIVKDLESDYDFLFQEDCDITIDGFKQSLEGVQERAESLKYLFEKATEMPTEEGELEQMEIQASFCERMIEFIDSLIEKIQEWREDALSAKEANDCFFEDVRFKEEDLPRIYNNLVSHRWIIKSRTSLNNFIYLFTGKGFRPSQPVLWKKTEDDLCLFLEEMTFDAKDLAKAAIVFEKKTRNNGYQLVKKRQLSAVRSRINNDRLYEKEKKLMEMYRDIFEFPDGDKLARTQAFG